jgi:hypothetical protein
MVAGVLFDVDGRSSDVYADPAELHENIERLNRG